MGCVAPRCAAEPTAGAVFCELHMRASSGQRGGWLSAHRRKAMGGERALDASNLAPSTSSLGLWIGGEPPFDLDIPKVDALFLCARELQPPTPAFHGFVYRCPLIDDHLDQGDILKALIAGRGAARLLAQRKRVLITCSQGRNRSALIAGFALGHLTRMTGDQIIEHIRSKRAVAGVLSNPAFCEYLHTYIDGKRPPPAPRRRR